MFFKKKPQNRRLGREYVLDVKLRSSHIRATRTRLMAVSAAVLFGLAFAVFLACWLGGVALDKFLYKNPAFAIQQIDLQTDGVLATEQLRQWSGIKAGDNLLAIDLSTVKRRIEAHPCIQSVSVQRIIPRTLRIRVSEREPVAQIIGFRQRTGGDLQQVIYQLDAQGCVMIPLEPRQRAFPVNAAAEVYPLITGLKPQSIQPGRVLDSDQVRAALGLVQAFDRSQIGGFVDLRKIDTSAPDVLVATTGQGSVITFGLNDFDRQLRRWRDIYEMGQRMSKAVASLDLAISNDIPVCWIEASSAPPTPPKLPKPWRTRRKHV